MKLRALAIFAIILVSLLPVYLLCKYLQRIMQPKKSMRRFLLWLLTVLGLIFTYTFLLVFIIRMLFPGA